jgi:hypothetical protein
MDGPLENAAPVVRASAAARAVLPSELDDNVVDPIDAREVFDLLRSINDPEVRDVTFLNVFVSVPAHKANNNSCMLSLAE